MTIKLARISLVATVLALLMPVVHAETIAECHAANKESIATCSTAQTTCLNKCYDTYGNAAGSTEFESMMDCNKDCENEHTTCSNEAAKRLEECLKHAN